MLQAMINYEYTCNLELQNWIPSHHTCIWVWNLVCNIIRRKSFRVTKGWQDFFFHLRQSVIRWQKNPHHEGFHNLQSLPNTATLFYLATNICFVWQQVSQRSLVQNTSSQSTCVLVQCTVVNTGFLLTTFKQGAEKYLINIFQLILGFCSPYLKKTMGMVSFGSQTRVTSNEHIVHCTMQNCWWKWGHYILFTMFRK